jgi:hypothetical protein
MKILFLLNLNDKNLFLTNDYDSKTLSKILKIWDIRKQSNNLLNEGEIMSIKIDDSKSDILTSFINHK